MGSYLKSRAGEIVLLAVASACLLLNFSRGFYIPEAVAGSVPLALGISLALSFVFYLGSYNRAAVAGLAVFLLAGAAALFLWLRGSGVDIVDAEGSGTAVYIYVFAALVIPLLAFLLSRPLPGIAVLAVLGALLAGVIDYLGYAVLTWANVLFCASAACLYMLRSYRRAAGAAALNGGKLALTAVLTAAGAAVLALGVFFLVVRPLDPPTLRIELISKYLDYQIFEFTGVARDYPIPDELLREPDPDPDEINSDEQDEEPDEEHPEETEVPPEETPGENPAYELGNSVEDNIEELSSVTYGLSVTTVLLLALLILALAAAAAAIAAAALRKRRRERLRALPPGEQIAALYRFFLQKFGAAGFRKPPAQTAGEYLAFNEERLAPYTEGTLSLAELTETFNAARYGGVEPDPETAERYFGFYPVFLKNYRRLHGALKYVLRRVSLRKSRRL